MKNRDYIAVDTETTGLNPKIDKIIEIGALKVRNDEIWEQFSMMVNPHRELSEQVRELTGIRQEEVDAAQGIEVVLPKFLEFAEDLPLLGHRISFDYQFLKQAAVNLGLSFERDGIDTLKISRQLMPPEERKTLSAACRYYGIETEISHRALADAQAAHLLYQETALLYDLAYPEIFIKKPLIYKVKKEQPASKRQKQLLQDLLKYHRIDVPVEIAYLSRNEISRLVDTIILQYGRMNTQICRKQDDNKQDDRKQHDKK